MKKIFSLALVSFILIFMVACGSGSGSSSTTNSTSTAGGTSAKGPFLQGSTVIAYKLDTNGTRSATASGTTTTDNLGTYSLNSISWSGATELVVSGNYFNENTGSTTQTGILSAIVNVSTGQNISANINIFTDLASKRIKKLMENNVSIIDARTQARAMIIDLFDLNMTSGTTLESLDLTKGSGQNSEANAELLRISAAIANNTSLLDDLKTAVEDGNVTSNASGITALTSLGQAVNNVNMNIVAQNLETSLNVADAPNASDTNDNTSYASNVHAPVITTVPAQVKVEDSATYNLTLVATDADVNDTVTFTSARSSNPALVTVSLVGTTLTINPIANQHGTSTIRLIASDGTYRTTESFTVTLTPVNDLPTLASLNSEFRAYGTNDFNITLQGSDVETATLSYAVVSSNTNVATVSNSGSIMTISPKNVGTSTITATVTDGDGGTAVRTMNIQVSALAIALRGGTQSKVYGDADPTFTYSITTGALINGDTFSGALSRASGTIVNSYATTIGSLSNSNYAITFVPGQLNITKAPLSATVSASTKVYGASNPTFATSFTGFKGADNASVVSNLTYTTTATTASTVGTYAVALNSYLAANYEVTARTSAVLTVTKAPITVTADAKSKAYTAIDPTFTYSVTSGTLINSDSLSGTLSRDSGENAGDYAITVGSLTHANYTITFVSNNLTITKINQSLLTFGNDVNKTTSSPSFTQTAVDGNGAGSVVYDSSDTAVATINSSGLISIVNIGTTTITATKEADINYNSITSSFTLNVTPSSPNHLVLTPSGSDINLTWDVVTGATYTVHYAEEPFGLKSVSEFSNIATHVSEAESTTSHTIGGLTGGTVYYVTVTATINSIESPASVVLNNAPSQHDTWLTSAAASTVETSSNLNTLNSSYSTQAYPATAYRLSEDKFAVAGYNSSDTSSDSTIFIYNPTTTTDLVSISTPGIKRPWLLFDIKTGKPATHNGQAIVLDGQPFTGSNSVGTLDLTTNAYVRTVVPSVDLKNASSHMMNEFGFVEGDIAYMSMLYRNRVENPGNWVIRWDMANNTFSHFDFTASVQANVGSAGFDDRIQFMISGKDSDHLLIGVYSNPTYYVLEVQLSTQKVVNKIQLNTVTGDAGYYEQVVYKGRLYMVPRAETGDTSGMKIVKINIQNFIAELVTIDEGIEKNTKRQQNSLSRGFSQIPTGETGIFIPRNVTITGNAVAKQHAMRLDLESLSFDFISLDASNFQNSVSDGSADELRFVGISGQENGQIISATYWKDVTVSDNNAQSLRNGVGVYHAKGSVIPSVQISGALVDPYIVGAILYQDTNGNKAFDTGEAESTATTAIGAFTFNTALTVGKAIRIKTQGKHEGVTYDSNLTALVDSSGQVSVVSPLTTFTAKGLTTGQLADILNYAATHNSDGSSATLLVDTVQWSIAANQLNLDPLNGNLLNADLATLTSNPQNLIELQASLTAYSLLKIFEGSTTLKNMDAATLYTQGTTANGAVATLAINLLKGVTNSLNVGLLTSVNTNLGTVRGALQTSFGYTVSQANAAAPIPTADMVSKIAVTVVEKLSTIGFTACNAEGGNANADLGNPTILGQKVTAALTAVATAQGSIDAKVMELGLNLYGLKYASNFPSAVRDGFASFATLGQVGSDFAGFLVKGLDAATAGAVTFRLNIDASNVVTIVALDANGQIVAIP